MITTTTQNVGIWVNSEARLEVRYFGTLPEPGGAETLVQVEFSGINPADVKHGRVLGIRNTVAGYDFSGTVLKVGPDSKYNVGDRIAGSTPSSIGRPAKFGTHQNYVIAPDQLTFAVPENLPLDHAACLSVSARTAADAFFNHLKYPLPNEPAQENGRSALLVWGGASSLGFMTIQFAKAIGVKHVFTTASPTNHAALKQLGATHTFDYRDTDVVSKIQAAANKAEVSLDRVFDAVGNPHQKTADTAIQCAVDSAIFVSSTIHPKAQMPVATPELPFTFQVPGTEKIVTVPPQPESAVRVLKALDWVVKTYGSQFRIPTVEVIQSDVGENLKYLEEKCAQGSNFRKICFKHPFHD